MNTPDLRHVDFDAYRNEAAELRRQAMNAAIDRALAALTSLLRPRSGRAAPATAARSAACTA